MITSARASARHRTRYHGAGVRDGRIIAYTVYPMPGGGGMATHEDITRARKELNARLKQQYELGREQEKTLRVRNFQFGHRHQQHVAGAVLLRFDHRLIVCNDRFVEVYNIPADRVRPGMKLTEIVDLRIEAGSFPAMTREEYISWRNGVASSNEQKTALSNCRTGAPSRSGTGRCLVAAGLPRMKTSRSNGGPRSRSNIWRTTMR
jgi:hypothetical protein